MINDIIDEVNNNKYFIGFMMIIVTIGGRFIISELSDEQKGKIDTPIFRKLFIFCAFFMATRDIITAILLTILFLILLESINFDMEKKDEEKDFGNLGYFIKY